MVHADGREKKGREKENRKQKAEGRKEDVNIFSVHLVRLQCIGLHPPRRGGVTIPIFNPFPATESQ